MKSIKGSKVTFWTNCAFLGCGYMKLRENMYYLLWFLFIYYLFVHFYIYNVWFVLANTRILVFIFKLFLSYNNVFTWKYAQIFVNIFVIIRIFGRRYSKVFSLRYTWGIPVGDLFPVKLQAVCLPFWWKCAPSWMFLKYFGFFYYLFC